jgi:hypothetical protein
MHAGPVSEAARTRGQDAGCQTLSDSCPSRNNDVHALCMQHVVRETMRALRWYPKHAATTMVLTSLKLAGVNLSS